MPQLLLPPGTGPWGCPFLSYRDGWTCLLLLSYALPLAADSGLDPPLAALTQASCVLFPSAAPGPLSPSYRSQSPNYGCRIFLCISANHPWRPSPSFGQHIFLCTHRTRVLFLVSAWNMPHHLSPQVTFSSFHSPFCTCVPYSVDQGLLPGSPTQMS